jgi:hypothetical protein
MYKILFSACRGCLRFRLIGYLLVWLPGCATGLGGTGSYLIDRPGVPSAGFKATSIGNLSVIRGPDVALGLDGEVLERLNQGGDQAGQWRLRVLAGLTQMPQPHQCFVGYELFVAPVFARAYDNGKSNFNVGLGLDAGLPLRLGPRKPVWRSDDLVALALYLVPSVAATWYPADVVELSGSLSLRVGLWSAVLP